MIERSFKIKTWEVMKYIKNLMFFFKLPLIIEQQFFSKTGKNEIITTPLKGN